MYIHVHVCVGFDNMLYIMYVYVGCQTFKVEATDSHYMKVIRASGPCQLAITTDSEIICALYPNNQVVGVWPFMCLRRYWHGEGVFGFEVGKRSQRGEATYLFASNEGEHIYNVMKQFLDRAKEATLKRKPPEGSNALKRISSDISHRPKLPLPQEVVLQNSPTNTLERPRGGPDEQEEAEKREGGQEEMESRCYDIIPPTTATHPEPQQIPPLSGYSSGGGGGPPLHTEVSGTSPSYVQHGESQQACGVRQWVNRTTNSLVQNHPSTPGIHSWTKSASLDATSFSVNSPNEDTYSHTQHIFPAPFQRHALEQNVITESTYHSLVHDKGFKGKRDSQLSQEGEALYDIAYPLDGSKGRQVLPGTREEYGTLDSRFIQHPNPRYRALSNLPLAPAKAAALREEEEEMDGNGGEGGVSFNSFQMKTQPFESTPKICVPLPQPSPPSSSALGPHLTPPRQTPQTTNLDFEDSMTENLLYNSQENLLKDITALELRQQAEEEAARKRQQEERAVSEPPPSVEERVRTGGGDQVVNSVGPCGVTRDNLELTWREKRLSGRSEDGVSEGGQSGILEEDEDENPPPIPPRNYLDDKSPTESCQNGFGVLVEPPEVTETNAM